MLEQDRFKISRLLQDLNRPEAFCETRMLSFHNKVAYILRSVSFWTTERSLVAWYFHWNGLYFKFKAVFLRFPVCLVLVDECQPIIYIDRNVYNNVLALGACAPIYKAKVGLKTPYGR